VLQGELVSEESGGRCIYRYAVGRHPEWSGRVGDLALRYFEKAGSRIRFESLKGFRDLVDTQQLAVALEAGARLDLDDEVRSVRLGLPGVPLLWEIEVPSGARLEFGYAVSGRIDEAVGFEIHLTDIASPGPPILLFEAALDKGDQVGRWQDAGVPLERWAGRGKSHR
jgi:hypothetical protein